MSDVSATPSGIKRLYLVYVFVWLRRHLNLAHLSEVGNRSTVTLASAEPYSAVKASDMVTIAVADTASLATSGNSTTKSELNAPHHNSTALLPHLL
jgi:hypothetical protein